MADSADYHVNDQVVLAGSHGWFLVTDFEKRGDAYWVKVRAISQVIVIVPGYHQPVPEGWVHEDEIATHLRREPPEASHVG